MSRKTLKITEEAHHKLSKKKVELNKKIPEHNVTFSDVIIDLVDGEEQ